MKIHLRVDKDFRAASKAHPGLLVDDLQAMAQRCRQGGHPIFEAPAIEGYTRLFVNDPFGNRIELQQQS